MDYQLSRAIRGNFMKNKRGFTLVEILIVIAIISVLASMIVVMAGSVMDKARTQSTRGTIVAIMNGCEQYKSAFSLYPDVNQDMSASIGFNPAYSSSTAGQILSASATNISDANMEEYNKRLRFMLEDQVYLIDEVESGPFIEEQLPKDESGEANLPLYIDAWGSFIRISPGRDHSSNVPTGPNNFRQNSRGAYMPDVYSLGPNTLDSVFSFAAAGSSFQSTGAFTLEGEDPDGQEIDDIVGWFIERAQ